MRRPGAGGKGRRGRGATALVLALALVATTASGCFGRFRAMNALYDFNKSASDNTVVRSLLMCAMIVIPVYEVTFLVDAIVLNTMDFFNHPNAVATTETLPDGSELRLARIDADTVRVSRADAAGRTQEVELVRVGANAGFVRSLDGRIIGGAERLADGRVVPRAQ